MERPNLEHMKADVVKGRSVAPNRVRELLDYVAALEARVAELEAECERDKKLMRYMEYVIRSLNPDANAE